MNTLIVGATGDVGSETAKSAVKKDIESER